MTERVTYVFGDIRVAIGRLTVFRGGSWAPDNDRIVFAGLREGVWNVYSVSRATRAVTRLTGYTSASGYVRDPFRRK